jgi:hypothetical protein
MYFDGSGVQTQGFMLAIHMLYYLSSLVYLDSTGI